MILVPPLPIVRPEFLDALRRSSGVVLFGPRLGSKTANFRIPENLPPGPLQELLPLRVLRVDSLPRFAPRPLKWNGESYSAETWVEQVASSLEPVARFEDGQGALFSHERFLYLAGSPDDRWLQDLMKMLASQQSLPIVELPPGVRTRRIGALRCFFNYNPFTVRLPALDRPRSPGRQCGFAAGGRFDRSRNGLREARLSPTLTDCRASQRLSRLLTSSPAMLRL